MLGLGKSVSPLPTPRRPITPLEISFFVWVGFCREEGGPGSQSSWKVSLRFLARPPSALPVILSESPCHPHTWHHTIS